jgi:hypothetical protein
MPFFRAVLPLGSLNTNHRAVDSYLEKRLNELEVILGVSTEVAVM